jgi:hypothetical protein
LALRIAYLADALAHTVMRGPAKPVRTLKAIKHGTRPELHPVVTCFWGQEIRRKLSNFSFLLKQGRFGAGHNSRIENGLAVQMNAELRTSASR